MIMNKKILISILMFILAVPHIYAQEYNRLIDKTIAIVGNSTILLSQIESEAQMRRFQGYVSDGDIRCEVLEDLMVSKLFYTQAKLDSLVVNPSMVESTLNDRMANIFTQLGGEKEVEKYFGKPVHKLRQEWKKIIEEQSLVQEMQQTVSQSVGEVIPRQVEEFYKRVPKDSLPIIPTQYQYSQIVIYPDKKKAETAVRERLLEFRNRILKGENFAMLATLYSEDNASAMRGGELGMASKNIFWPEFSDAAMALKEGQVSQIVETPDGFHIIQMITKQGDMFNARHILLKLHYTDEDRIQAYSRLDTIKNLITSDTLTFEQAAMMFSEDPQSRTNGGLVYDPYSGAPIFEIDQLKPQDYNMLKDMKPGEISEPFESLDNEGRSGNTIYKIVRFDKLIPSHTATFKDDFSVLQNVTKMDMTYKVIEKFIEKKQATTYIVVDPLFQNCEFKRKGWIK